MRLIYLLLVSCLFVGCVSAKIVGNENIEGRSFVTANYEIVKIGTSLNQQRRELAITMAKESCGGGRVQLISESEQEGNGGGVNFNSVPGAGMGLMLPINKQFNYMKFECIDKIATAQIF